MNLTDYIVCVWVVCLLWNGWRQGFLRTLIGPILLIVFSVLSLIYYHQTRNFMLALAMATFGPILGGMAFSVGLWVWNRGVNPKNDVSLISRVIGSVLNFFWGGIVIIISLYFFSLIPLNLPRLGVIPANVKESFSYSLLRPILPQKMPSGEQLQRSLKVLEDPQRAQRIESSKGFKELTAHPKVQAVLNDESLTEKIKNGNYFAILKDPKILNILNDPELLEKFWSFQKELMQNADESRDGSLSPKTKTLPKEEPAPKVYNFKKN